MDGLLPGKLSYVFLVSILDATGLALAMLLWFRHSVRTLMRRRGASAEAAAMDRDHTSVDRAESRVPSELSFALFEPGGVQSTVHPSSTGQEPALRMRLLIAYTLGAAAYSRVITTLQLAGQDPGLPWVAWLGRWWENISYGP
jgi:hypothetical protein